MSPTFRVLTVCVGNVCRSPLAERLLADRLPADCFSVASAGVRALAGQPMDPDAAAAMAPYGGSADGFVARDLTEAIVDEADLVLTAGREIRSGVLAVAPQALRRTFTLLEFAALLDHVAPGPPADVVRAAAANRSVAADVEQDVPDPYRRGAEAHAQAAATIDAAVTRIVSGLVS